MLVHKEFNSEQQTLCSRLCVYIFIRVLHVVFKKTSPSKELSSLNLMSNQFAACFPLSLNRALGSQQFNSC